MAKQINAGLLADIGSAIRHAREAKALTQRELGSRVGIPQSHLSKIEQGGVDLQLSSLVELARALDLELRMVPRQALPAVDGAVKAVAIKPADASTSRALATLADQARWAETLSRQGPIEELVAFQETIRDLQHHRFDPPTLKALRHCLAPVRGVSRLPGAHSDREKLSRAIADATRRLQHLRDIKAHAPRFEEPSATHAYRLHDDDDD